MMLGLFSAIIAACGMACSPHQHPKQSATGSYLINPDASVSFHFAASDAKSVVLEIEGTAKKSLQRDQDGTWTCRTDPLKPDLYVYKFVVDGQSAGDPNNALTKPTLVGPMESLLHIKGAKPELWDDAEVPHGSTEVREFKSDLLSEKRKLVVYLPPGYAENSADSYHVLYLLHGVMETEQAWQSAGRVSQILDNLIQQQRAKKMIIVMPLGYGFSSPSKRIGEQFDPTKQRFFMELVEKSLLSESIPFVESNYRVRKDAGGTAIAGCSMGGAQSLFIGTRNPIKFGSIGSFSGAFIMYTGGFSKWIPSGKLENTKLVVVSCARNDFLYKSNEQAKQILTQSGVPFKDWNPDGEHTWNVWRRNLIDFAELLFWAI
jgi:enterochelin esterase-like enzyme